MPLFQSKARCGLKVRKSNGLLYITCFYYFQIWNRLMTAFTARESTSSCNQLFSTLRFQESCIADIISTLIKIIINHGSCSVHWGTLTLYTVPQLKPRANGCNIVGCFIWCLLAQSCVLLGIVAPCLKVVKPLSQHFFCSTHFTHGLLWVYKVLWVVFFPQWVVASVSPPPPGGTPIWKGRGCLSRFF